MYEWSDTSAAPPLESILCALCGSGRVADIPHASRGLMKAVVCTDCGLMYLNPRPTAETYAEFYNANYWQNQRAAPNLDELRVAMEEEYIQPELPAFVEIFAPHISSTSRLLDVGSGFGAELRRMRERFSCSVVGIEPNRTTAELTSTTFGLDVFPGTLREFCAARGNERFDVVIINHVLEHMLDPVETMQEIRSLLSPQGCVYVGVPNMSQARKFVTERHPYGFTPWSMLLLLLRCGLKPIYFSATPVLKRGLEVIATSIENNCQPIPFEIFLAGADWRQVVGRANRLGWSYHFFAQFGQPSRWMPVFVRSIFKKVSRRVFQVFGSR